MEREQVSRNHFHRLLVIKVLAGRKKFRAIRRGVPPHTYNITMQGRAIIRQLDDGSLTDVRKGTIVRDERVSPPRGCGKGQVEAG